MRFLRIVWWHHLADVVRNFDRRRRGKSRVEKRRFDIYCEGGKTEPEYFYGLKRVLGFEEVVLRIAPAVGVPMTIAREAIKANKGSREGDQVWGAFDRDDHPEFSRAVALCRANGIGVARSNPCFELWLILHMQDQDAPQSRWKLKDIWRKLEKEIGCEDLYQELASRLDDAERRAAAQLTRRDEEGAPHGNPSTTVGELIRALQEAGEF